MRVKKYLIALFGVCFLIAGLQVPGMALSPYAIASEIAVLMDAETGQVLFDKNMSKKAYPASTTKIMTCLLASEHSTPQTEVVASPHAVDIREWNSANISLVAGERMTMEDAMHGMMLSSANDAANVIAEHVGGSLEGFNEMMNQKAWQIGAYDTRFVNAHGLHQPGHYTTGYDLALITRYAAKNPDFMHYFGATRYTMPGTNLQPVERSFFNYQSMLMDDTAYYDPSVKGGKIGYTTEAQHTMSTIATRNGRTLICVVLNSAERTQKFTDTMQLLDYGFNQFKQVVLPASSFSSNVISTTDGKVSFRSKEDFTALIPKDMDEEQVQVEFNLPETFEHGEELPAAFNVVIASEHETFPKLLGTQPIHSNLTQTEYVELTPSAIFFGNAVEPVPLFPILIIALLAGGLVLLIFAVILRHYNANKRLPKNSVKTFRTYDRMDTIS